MGQFQMSKIPQSGRIAAVIVEKTSL